MPVNGPVASPIAKGGIIVTPNADTTVLEVSEEDILVQSSDTKEKFRLSPLQPFFEDELGLVNGERPQRQRRQRVLFNALILGGCLDLDHHQTCRQRLGFDWKKFLGDC